MFIQRTADQLARALYVDSLDCRLSYADIKVVTKDSQNYTEI